MLHIVVGFVLLLGVIAIVYYFINRETAMVNHDLTKPEYKTFSKTNSEQSSDNNNGPLANDTVLVELIHIDTTNSVNAIMWNSNNIFDAYNIKTEMDGIVIAEGISKSSTNLHKIKNIPLTKGKTYIVTVNSTSITIPFYPPIIVDSKITDDLIDITTESVPTDVEIIINNIPVTPTNISIKVEPPGIICTDLLKVDNLNEVLDPPTQKTIMIYNGKNTGSILYTE